MKYLQICCLLFCFSLNAYSYEEVLTTEQIEGALENTRLNDVVNRYLATILMYDPETATTLGIHESDNLLTQRNRERYNLQFDALKKLRARLHEIKKETLYPNLQIDYEIMDHMLEVDVFNMENLNILGKMPQYYLNPFLSIYSVLTKDFEDYTIRAANALARLKAFPEALLQAERNLNHPPKIWTEQAIKQTRDSISSVSEFIPLFRRYTRYDPILRAQVDDAINKARTSLERYLNFLSKELMIQSDGDFRVGDYFYGFYLERWHGLDRTPGAVYRYTRKAFKNALKDLEKEAFNIDPMLAKSKGWKAVLDNLPKEHPPLDNVLKIFQEEFERAYQHFDEHKVVGFPKQRILVNKMPLFLSALLPYAAYAPPFALDEEKVSDLYIALPSEKLPEKTKEKILSAGFNYPQIELLVSNLVMPGLHLQNYESSLNKSKIRKISRQPMITNGWACYSEALSEEMGFYNSYWSRFLRIYLKTLRAARSYLDAALHTKKMKYEEAVSFLTDNLHLPRVQAEQEVLKISLTPTEGITYLLGMEKITEIRKYYERTEEKYFDLRKFHSYFLRLGGIPIESARKELRRLKKEEEKKIKVSEPL
ncbi:MAG: DUF885 domain-containing protein [Elusimicrobia bacterium]|nr:DUF885 domain-containing protein [Elusimicrobiota bacterium]